MTGRAEAAPTSARRTPERERPGRPPGACPPETPSMSLGKRRSKPHPGPSSGPPTRSTSARPVRPASVRGWPALAWSPPPSSRPPRSSTAPGRRSPSGSASGPAARSCVGVEEFRRKDPVKTNAERQDAADKVGPIPADQRPGPDPGAGRAAARPGRRRQRGPRPASCSTRTCDELEPRRADLSRHPRRRRQPRAPRGSAPADPAGVRPLDRPRRARSRQPATRRASAGATDGPHPPGRPAAVEAVTVPRDLILPERIRQARRRRSPRSSPRRSPARSSASGSSRWSPSSSPARPP